MEKVVNTKTAVFQEFQLFSKGGVRSYTSSNFPLLNWNNNVYAVGSVITDITERKKAEEVLNQTN